MKNKNIFLQNLNSKRAFIALLLFLIISCAQNSDNLIKSTAQESIPINIEKIYKNDSYFSKKINIDLSKINSKNLGLKNESYNFDDIFKANFLKLDSFIVKEKKVINFHSFSDLYPFDTRIDTIIIFDTTSIQKDSTINLGNISLVKSYFRINNNSISNFILSSISDTLFKSDTITLSIKNNLAEYEKILKFSNLDISSLNLALPNEIITHTNNNEFIIQKNNITNFINDSINISIIRNNNSNIDSIIYSMNQQTNIIFKSLQNKEINFSDSIFYIKGKTIENNDIYIYQINTNGENFSSQLVFIELPPYKLSSDSLLPRQLLVLKDSSAWGTNRVYYNLSNNLYNLTAQEFIHNFTSNDTLSDSIRINYSSFNNFTYSQNYIFSDSTTEFTVLKIDKLNASYIGQFTGRNKNTILFKNSDNDIFTPLKL